MATTVLLRTMTRLSTLNGGQYAGRTVGNLIDAGMAGYLRWAYYNVGCVNFRDDVLKELGIERTIAKPGTDAGLWDEIRYAGNRKACARMSDEERMHRVMHKRRVKRIRIEVTDRVTSYVPSKDVLRAQVQGRI